MPMDAVPSIPRTLHYCWFGGSPLPQSVLASIDTWKRVMPDFEIVRWDEDSWDVEAREYTRRNIARRKWAFVSDVCRLDVLHRHGGVYLDTDVHAFKSLSPFLRFPMFLGMMFDDSVGTAVMGARPSAPLVRDLLDLYDEMPISDVPNNDTVTGFLLKHYPEFVLANVSQTLHDGAVVMQKEYFERPALRRSRGYTRHLVSNTWHDAPSTRSAGPAVRSLKRLLGPFGSAIVANLATIPRAAYFPDHVKHRLSRKRPLGRPDIKAFPA